MSRKSNIHLEEFFQLCEDEAKNLETLRGLPDRYIEHGLGNRDEHYIIVHNIYQWVILNKEEIRQKFNASENSEVTALQLPKEETNLAITFYLIKEPDSNIILVFDKNSKFLQNDTKNEEKRKIIAVGGTSKIRESVGFNKGKLEFWVTSVPKNDKIYQIESNSREKERNLARRIFPNPFLLPTYYSQDYKFKAPASDDDAYQAKIASLSPLKEKDLAQFLNEPYPPNFSVENLLWIIFSLIAGASKLHKNGIFHQDLKPKNILLSLGKEEKIDDNFWYSYIGDFGSITDSNDDDCPVTPQHGPFDHPLVVKKLSEIMEVPRYRNKSRILEILNNVKHNSFTFGHFNNLDDAKKIPCLRWFFKYYEMNPHINYIQPSQNSSKEYDTWSVSSIIVTMIEKFTQERKSETESHKILGPILNLVENRLTKLEQYRGDCDNLLKSFSVELNTLMVDKTILPASKVWISKIFTAQCNKLKIVNPVNIFFYKLNEYKTKVGNELKHEQNSIHLSAFNFFKRNFITKIVKNNAIENIIKVCNGEEVTLSKNEVKACFDSRLGNIILSCWKIIETGYPRLHSQLVAEKNQYDQRENSLHRNSCSSINSDSMIARLKP